MRYSGVWGLNLIVDLTKRGEFSCGDHINILFDIFSVYFKNWRRWFILMRVLMEWGLIFGPV